MKEEIINSLKVDINSVVDKRNLELEDRKRRELNITIFNLMEHSSDNTSENKKADELDIRFISVSLGIENLNITTSFFLFFLSILSRSNFDHHLRCGGWLNFEFSKREKHSGWAIKTIYKKLCRGMLKHIPLYL